MTKSMIRFAATGALAMLVLGSTFPAAAAGPLTGARPVVPADFPLVANVVVGSRTFNGFFVTIGATVKLTQKRKGATLATATKVADASGDVSLKLKPLQPGDAVLIDVDGAQRTLTIPDLRLSIDAASDRLSGRVPTSQLDGHLAVASQVGSYTLGGDNQDFTAHADGTFSEDLTSIHDIQGGELVRLDWVSPANDSFSLDSFAPAVTTQVGLSTVEVYGKGGSTATVTLKASNGAVRGSAKVTIPRDGRPATATFHKSGAKVAVKAGDRIVHSAAPAISFKVLANTLVLTKTGGGDVSATCFPSSLYVLGSIFGGGAFDYLADGATDSTGALSVSDISNTGTTLPSGYQVMLICENADGYAQNFRATVP